MSKYTNDELELILINLIETHTLVDESEHHEELKDAVRKLFEEFKDYEYMTLMERTIERINS